jgi:ADP-ribose pyrophosphatase
VGDRQGNLSEEAERIVGRETVAQGRIVRFEKVTAELPDGKLAVRDVVRHPGGAAIVALDGEGYVYLVRQYRTPFDGVTLEIPAGKLEPGEDPQVCAERELAEEVGFTAGRVRMAMALYSTPGFCDEVIHIFLAEGLKEAEAKPDDDEFLNVVMLPLDAAVEMVRTGELRDAKSVAGVLYADMERRRGGAGGPGAGGASGA